MIIDQLRRDERDGNVVLSARVRARHAPFAIPHRLYFEFPADLAPERLRGDAFAAALSPLASALRDDLDVDAPLSPRLAYGLTEHQAVLRVFDPARFAVVCVRSPQFTCAPQRAQQAPPGALAAFSGGVDSTFRLYRGTTFYGRPNGVRVTGALMIHGFDLPAGRPEPFASIRARFEPALEEIGVRLVTLRTNARAFVNALDWRWVHGATLAGAGLLFQHRWSSFQIPSSLAWRYTRPWGSATWMDSWLATEAMSIRHLDAEHYKLEKLAAIADFPIARTHLRVCDQRGRGGYNCGRCDKCIWTMGTLSALGLQDQFPTLPWPLDRRRLRRYLVYSIGLRAQGVRTARLAWSQGRRAVAFDWAAAYARSQGLRAWRYGFHGVRNAVRRLAGG